VKGFRPQPPAALAPQPAASARAYWALRRTILHGELAPGSVVGEVEAAAALGVSRTPVREALRTLLGDGLLQEGRRRQLMVTTISPDARRQILLMRTALEQLAAREAALRADLSDLDQLRLNTIRARRAIDADDPQRFLDDDEEFHLLIARAASLDLVEEALRRLCGLTRLGMPDTRLDRASLGRSADEHDQIITALEATDPQTAALAVTRHLTSASDASG
jgi:GntR family transcriptional regulator, rspAB operon transcriptional repressor